MERPGRNFFHIFTVVSVLALTLNTFGVSAKESKDPIVVPDEVSSIQEAINQVSPSGIVEVKPGTYSISLSLPMKSFTLRSANPGRRKIRRSTVLEAKNGNHITVPGRSPKITIKGFTFKNGIGKKVSKRTHNGSVEFRSGGAIYIPVGAEVRIINNHFHNNHSGKGGSIFAGEHTDVTIRNNYFKQNYVDRWSGGVISTHFANVNIIDNTFVNNRAKSGFGGALHISRGRGTIKGNRFLDNFAKAGGAVILTEFDGTFSDNQLKGNTADFNSGGLRGNDLKSATNNRFVANQAKRGGGVYIYNPDIPVFKNNQFKKNQAETGSAIYLKEYFNFKDILENNTFHSSPYQSIYSPLEQSGESINTYKALSKGTFLQARKAVKNMKDVNEYIRFGSTPLIVALKNRSNRFVKFLINRGADVNKPTLKGRPPLDVAMARDKPEAVIILLQNGANVTQFGPIHDRTLFKLIDHEMAKPIPYVLKQLEQYTERDNDYYSSLAANFKEDHEKIFRKLVKPFDTGPKKKFFVSEILVNSLESPNIDYTKWLVDQGANVNHEAQSGVTPLIEATRSASDTKVIEYLIIQGADLTDQFNKKYPVHYLGDNDDIQDESYFNSVLKRTKQSLKNKGETTKNLPDLNEIREDRAREKLIRNVDGFSPRVVHSFLSEKSVRMPGFGPVISRLHLERNKIWLEIFNPTSQSWKITSINGIRGGQLIQTRIEPHSSKYFCEQSICDSLEAKLTTRKKIYPLKEVPRPRIKYLTVYFRSMKNTPFRYVDQILFRDHSEKTLRAQPVNWPVTFQRKIHRNNLPVDTNRNLKDFKAVESEITHSPYEEYSSDYEKKLQLINKRFHKMAKRTEGHDNRKYLIKKLLEYRKKLIQSKHGLAKTKKRIRHLENVIGY